MQGRKTASTVDTTADLRLLGDSAEGAEKDEVIRPCQVETLGDDADGGDQHPEGGWLHRAVEFALQPVEENGDEGLYSGQVAGRVMPRSIICTGISEVLAIYKNAK